MLALNEWKSYHPGLFLKGNSRKEEIGGRSGVQEHSHGRCPARLSPVVERGRVCATDLPV